MRSKNINEFFEDLLADINCQNKETKSYIIGLYCNYKNPTFDLSTTSVTLYFSEAREKQDFSIYQNLGDYLFFSSTMFPQHLETSASKDYFDTIAKLSYYSCFKLINKKWLLFEEISDSYCELTSSIKEIFDNQLKPNFLQTSSGEV